MINSTELNGVLNIELCRPEKKNAFTGAMYDTLAQILSSAEASPTIKVILLSGAGRAFSAGNDLEDFRDCPPSGPEAPAFQFLRTLAQTTKPIIAAVNGIAVGIGATMLFHCDLVYAQDSARFVFPFVSLGLIPEGASSLLLPRLVGHQRASEILFFGEPLSAEETRQIGLVNQVISDRSVLEYAQQQALRLTKLPFGSVRETKALLRRDVADVERTDPTSAVVARINAEAKIFAARVNGAAAKEAMAAFIDKRHPNFDGLD